jgi:peptide/nickel transport system substrate-binding protein
LTRFDGYHGILPALKDAYIIKANDVNTRILMLQAGDADIAYIPISYESLFLGNDSFEITKGLPTFTIEFAGFNMEINTTQAALFGSDVPSDFFMDKNVRKAFVHLMNTASYIDDYLDGNGIQLNGPIPMGMFGYNESVPAYEYNVTMAKEYLENATNPGTGNSWWEDGFTIAFIYNAGNLARETACQYLKYALESLNSFPGTHGIFQATINTLDWPTYLANLRMSPSPLPVFFLGWFPDYADPDDYVNPMLYSYGSYPLLTGYSNATIDSLAIAASMELNSTARMEMYHEIVNLCYDDAPYIWLAQMASFQITRSWLNGYVFNPMYMGDYFAAMSKSNDPPNAAFDVDPSAGPTMTDFTFDASSSDDPNQPSSLLEVRWDWENDSVWDTGWSQDKNATHQYASEGTYEIAMEIRDAVGLTNVTYRTVIVDDTIPEFSSAIVPVLVIAAIVAVTRLSRKMRR